MPGSDSGRELQVKPRRRQKCAMGQCKLKLKQENEQQTQPSRTLIHEWTALQELLMTNCSWTRFGWTTGRDHGRGYGWTGFVLQLRGPGPLENLVDDVMPWCSFWNHVNTGWLKTERECSYNSSVGFVASSWTFNVKSPIAWIALVRS